MATTPDGLLLQLASWHKEGLQRLTAVVDKHKASLAVLIQLAEADIVELVAPFAEAEKPRNKRRTGAKQQQQKVRGEGRAGGERGSVFGPERRGAAPQPHSRGGRGRAS